MPRRPRRRPPLRPAAGRSRSARWSCRASRAAHGHAGDPNGGGTVADRDALALLAADALLDVEVVAQRVDRRDHAGAVADEVGAADGGGDLAVLDQVALDDAEHELAGDGVHLPAAERLGVQAARRLADDLLRVVGAREDVG